MIQKGDLIILSCQNNKFYKNHMGRTYCIASYAGKNPLISLLSV